MKPTTALAKVKRRNALLQKRFETLQAFLCSNPFLERDFEFVGDDGTSLSFRRNNHECWQFHARKGVVIAGSSHKGSFHKVAFSPTDSQALVNFLVECGYFTGHEAMQAMKERHKEQME